VSLPEHADSTCLLPHHFARVLVFTDSEKNWLPQPIIPRPLREFYLADDRRPNGNASFRQQSTLRPNGCGLLPGVKKGTFFSPNFV
jgi:hypothetical protein